MAITVRHPLEPLSAAEVQQAVQLLKTNGKVTPTTRFVSVSLKEPPKEAVHGLTASWPPTAPSRSASSARLPTVTAHRC